MTVTIIISDQVIILQVGHGCDVIRADARLRAGYHAVGLSQGGLLLRGVAQLCPAPRPPMRSLVTLGSPHQGIFGIPECVSSEVFDECTLMRNLLSEGAYLSWVQGLHTQSFRLIF